MTLSPLESLAVSINAPPVDQNLLQPSTFKISFSRLPYVQWFLQKVNVPGISTSPQIQETPFINAPIPSNKMTYEYLSMTFTVDEGLWAWTSVADWLKGLTIPDSFQEYQNLTLQQRLQMQSTRPQYSDAILTILSNKNNPILALQFTEVFPVTLSGLQLSTQEDATTIITATAEFGFTSMDVNRQV